MFLSTLPLRFDNQLFVFAMHQTKFFICLPGETWTLLQGVSVDPIYEYPVLLHSVSSLVGVYLFEIQPIAGS